MRTCNDDDGIGRERSVGGVNGELCWLSDRRRLNSTTAYLHERVVLHDDCVRTVCKSYEHPRQRNITSANSNNDKSLTHFAQGSKMETVTKGFDASLANRPFLVSFQLSRTLAKVKTKNGWLGSLALNP